MSTQSPMSTESRPPQPLRRPIWFNEAAQRVQIIDQRLLPHRLAIVDLIEVDDAIRAIRDMSVRGAPLIGVTAAWGVYLIAEAAAVRGLDRGAASDFLASQSGRLRAARPTAVNLNWAVERMTARLAAVKDPGRMPAAARVEAEAIAEEEVENCRLIGEHGCALIADAAARKKGEAVNILTHCNAGWLACVEWGTATAPIYAARAKNIPLHVWVDETRPLNQGARLTAWELARQDVPHTVITDNAGGHLMQHGLVDLVIVGTDRTTYTGDVANKIGTYLKALAAYDNAIPFYVALPSSTFDWRTRDGLRDIPIEERDPDEVRYVQGILPGESDDLKSVLVPPAGSRAANYAFDVTPARLVSAFITERGVCQASEEGIRGLFPEKIGR